MTTPSLLRELQNLATDDKAKTKTLLLKAQILAARIGHDDFETWLRREVDGYPEKEPLPDYRTEFARTFRGDFRNIAWAASGAQIPLWAFQDDVRPKPTFDVRWPIATVEEFAASKEETIKLVMDAAFTRFVTLYDRMQCVAIWEEVPRHAFRGVLEAVRARILRYSIEIEKANPKAGEAAPGEHPVPAETLRHLQQTVILGGNNIVSVSGRDTVQLVQLVAGDLGALLESMKRLGLSQPDIDELRAAIQAEPKKPAKGFGPKVQAWLGAMLSKAAEGTWQVAAPTGAQLLATLILRYYGIQ